MLEKINETLCTIDIAHERKSQAEIKSLAPFHVHLSIGHRRLAQLQERIEAANKCRDYARARMWQDNHDRLVRALAGQAAMELGPQLNKRKRYIDWVLTALFAASTLIYINPALWKIGVLLDMMLVIALYFVHMEWVARVVYINDIIASSFGANRAQDVALKLQRRKGPANAKPHP